MTTVTDASKATPTATPAELEKARAPAQQALVQKAIKLVGTASDNFLQQIKDGTRDPNEKFSVDIKPWDLGIDTITPETYQAISDAVTKELGFQTVLYQNPMIHVFEAKK